MEENNKYKLWTIGHSTRTFDELASMLKQYHVECLVDVRHYPGSRKYPQFNKEFLQVSFPEHNIKYIHCERLGGRRKARKDSVNTAWKHPSFRGYADYMETDEFKRGITDLEQIAEKHRTAIMCSEAVWWRCHRSLIADTLKSRGWTVVHIMAPGNVQEHPYTSPAKIVDGYLSYK